MHRSSCPGMRDRRSDQDGGNEIQVDARYLPEKAEPDEESEIPSQQDELHDGKGDEDIPVTGWRQAPPAFRQGIPSGGVQRNAAIPQPQAHGVSDNQDTGFEWDRIANPYR